MLYVTCLSERKKSVYSRRYVRRDTWGRCWFMDCLKFGWCSRAKELSREMRIRDSEELSLSLSLSLSSSAASFLMTRRNSHRLSAEEKGHAGKTGVGCMSAPPVDTFFLLLSAIRAHSHLLSPLPTQRRTGLYRDCVMQRTGPSLECSFANFSTVYGFSLVLWLCLTVTFNGFMCLHLETLEHLCVCVCVCVTEWMCVGVHVAYHDDRQCILWPVACSAGGRDYLLI